MRLRRDTYIEERSLVRMAFDIGSVVNNKLWLDVYTHTEDVLITDEIRKKEKNSLVFEGKT